jgi:hypothetical protein
MIRWLKEQLTTFFKFPATVVIIASFILVHTMILWLMETPNPAVPRNTACNRTSSFQ